MEYEYLMALLRFWSRTRSYNECWTIEHPKGWERYVTVSLGCGRKPARAHRLAWEFENGEKMPEGALACHHCDNPPCFNPRHIYAGTNQSNADDRRMRWGHKPKPLVARDVLKTPFLRKTGG